MWWLPTWDRSRRQLLDLGISDIEFCLIQYLIFQLLILKSIEVIIVASSYNVLWLSSWTKSQSKKIIQKINSLLYIYFFLRLALKAACFLSTFFCLQSNLFHFCQLVLHTAFGLSFVHEQYLLPEIQGRLILTGHWIYMTQYEKMLLRCVECNCRIRFLVQILIAINFLPTNVIKYLFEVQFFHRHCG